MHPNLSHTRRDYFWRESCQKKSNCCHLVGGLYPGSRNPGPVAPCHLPLVGWMVVLHTALHIFQLIQYRKHVDEFAQRDQICFRHKVLPPLCVAQASHLPTKSFNCISLMGKKKKKQGVKAMTFPGKKASLRNWGWSNEKHHWSRKMFKACKANEASAQAFQLHLCGLAECYKCHQWFLPQSLSGTRGKVLCRLKS